MWVRENREKKSARRLLSASSVSRSTLATFIDFYDLLSLPRNGNISQEDIKRAYHRKLLLLHPDKLKLDPSSNATQPTQTNTADIATLKEAFSTLFDPEKRRIYDASLEKRTGTRPAQVVSLEDFTIIDDTSGGAPVYSHACRCGGYYYISVIDMEVDVHLISCETCSESIWVGYEVVEEDGPAE